MKQSNVDRTLRIIGNIVLMAYDWIRNGDVRKETIFGVGETMFGLSGTILGLSENIFDLIHCEEGCRLQLAVEDVVLNEE